VGSGERVVLVGMVGGGGRVGKLGRRRRREWAIPTFGRSERRFSRRLFLFLFFTLSFLSLVIPILRLQVLNFILI
jgi:hypothetical protein